MLGRVIADSPESDQLTLRWGPAILLHLAMLGRDEAGAAREPREPQTNACRMRFIRKAPLPHYELVL
jgi:hypothetical protein